MNEPQLPIFFQDLSYNKQMEILEFYGATTAEELNWGIGGGPITVLLPVEGGYQGAVINETVIVNEDVF